MNATVKIDYREIELPVLPAYSELEMIYLAELEEAYQARLREEATWSYDLDLIKEA